MLFFFYLQKRAVQVITNSWVSSAPLFTEYISLSQTIISAPDVSQFF